MNKVTLLPYWQLPDSIPSVYDTQSGSYQEMVAKVYGAMRTLQKEYNAFIDKINNEITNFIDSVNKDQEEFEEKINKIVHDYIIAIDTKIAHQDRVIADAVSYMKDNLTVSITQLIIEMRESGELSEDILNAFEDITDRISTIENNLSTAQANIQSLDERLTAEENKETYFIYNADTEELSLNVEVREVS